MTETNAQVADRLARRRLEAAITSALTTALVAGRYQASNGARKRAHGDQMEAAARRELAAALEELRTLDAAR